MRSSTYQTKGAKNLQYKIREKRIEKKLSQEELAKKSNVSRTIISGLESGSVKTTTTDTLLKLAQALECNVRDIFLC